MTRPVTPENRFRIYKDGTICKTTKPITVRIENVGLKKAHGINLTEPQELPVGSEVIVSDAQTISLTGVNEPSSPTNTAYRIEGKLKLTVYEEISKLLDGKNCSNEKLRKHSNLIPMVRPPLGKAFPFGTIVATKESTTHNGKVLPPGELFVIGSYPKTPKGQNFSSKSPIDNALYDVYHVEKIVREYKVRNPSRLLVLHKDLQRVPQEGF